jgi:hypothetical protein
MGIETTQNGPLSADEGERWARWRVWGIRIWYGLLSVWTLLMAQGVVALALGQAGPGERFVYATVTAWKLLAIGGILWICWTAGRSVVAFQAVVVGWVGWLGSERLFAVQPEDATPVASAITTVVLWLLPLVLLRPHRGQLLRVHARPSVILLPLALVAAVPLCLYAVRQGDLATGLTGLVDARYAACGLGAVLAVQAVYAALRPRSSRWLPRFVALVAAWIGLAATIWPHDLTSLGRGWGFALICWALVFVAGSEVEAARGSAWGAARAAMVARRRRRS